MSDVNQQRPTLTVVIPAFNEQAAIANMIAEIRAVASADDLLRRSVNVVVVSDGSTDDTYSVSVAALGADLPGEVVQLVRNVGSHTAVRSGFDRATGAHVAVLSADGQDPPDVLSAMIRAFKPGIDIVWGERISRKNDSFLTRTMSRSYYWLFRRLTGMDYPPRGYDIVMLSERAIRTVHLYRERNASIFLLLFNLGLGQTSVPYARRERRDGSSRWTFRRRATLAIDMLTAFTAAPIRLVSTLGIVVGLFGLAFGSLTLLRGLLGHIPYEGWASLMVMTSLMGGITLIAIALIGEYLWRTLDEVRGRPLYIEAFAERKDWDE